MPVNLKPYQDEIEAGLPNEQTQWDLAQERQAFYDFDGFKYERRFKRDAESSFDFQGRSHRASGFLHQCVCKLTDHLYSPGPSRRWDDPSGDKVLQRIYADNLINALLHWADIKSTLNDSVAIQIDATGNFALKPIKYRFWARQNHVVYCDPDNADEPQVVITRDKYDGQTRFRLWSDTEVWTSTTKKANENYMDGRAAFLRTKEPHDYGCLPFSFFHYHLPIESLDEIVAIGTYLWKADIHIDDRLSLLDESIKKYINPVAWSKGMPSGWKPILEAGRFINLPRSAPSVDSNGNYVPGESTELGYTSALVDIAGSWDDTERFIRQALSVAGIPESTVKMEATTMASGVSLIIEQEPLLKRAENRRPMAMVYETDLARRTLLCVGNHYGVSGLVRSAEQGRLVPMWPLPRLAVSTPDVFALQLQKVASGVMSHLMLVQAEYNCERDQALEIIKQIAEDTKDTEAAFPELAAVTGLPDPDPGPDGDSEGKPARDDPTDEVSP